MKTANIVAMISIVIGAFALFIKLTLPSTVQVIIEGQHVEIKHIPNIYSMSDVIIIGASCFMLGASIVYLIFSRGTIAVPREIKVVNSSASIEHWKEVLKEIKNEDEHRIYQLIMEDGGSILQSKLVQVTGFPKGKVSIILDKLEARGLLERKRHGMSNMVVLKQDF
jgi:uncharacterized membrane protein